MPDTTNTTALRAAIEAMEGATEGSHDLDCRVFAAVSGWSYPLFGSAASHFRDTDYTDYTTSLDAALTLVPEGWFLYRIDHDSPTNNPAWGWGASLRYHVNPEIGRAVGWSRHGMALALCLAALRARLKMEEGK